MTIAEYIEREALIEKCKAIIQDKWNDKVAPVSWSHAYADFIEDIENQPATDVAPVVHGRWMTWEEQFPGFKPHINDKLGVFCSLCHAHSDCISPYCPNCGAKMDIDEEE